MKKVRVIQIGTGHDHAACTIRSLKSLPDRYEIIGVAEPNENFKDRLKNLNVSKEILIQSDFSEKTNKEVTM